MSEPQVIQPFWSPRAPENPPAGFEEFLAALKGMTGTTVEVMTSPHTGEDRNVLTGLSTLTGLLGAPEIPGDRSEADGELFFPVYGPRRAGFRISREAFVKGFVTPGTAAGVFGATHLRVGRYFAEADDEGEQEDAAAQHWSRALPGGSRADRSTRAQRWSSEPGPRLPRCRQRARGDGRLPGAGDALGPVVASALAHWEGVLSEVELPGDDGAEALLRFGGAPDTGIRLSDEVFSLGSISREGVCGELGSLELQVWRRPATG